MNLHKLIREVETVRKHARRHRGKCCSSFGISYDMPTVLESVNGFQIEGEVESLPDFLPNGAPTSWSTMSSIARIALDRAAARLTKQPERKEPWDKPGRALDPYWSTSPIVIHNQGYTNSLARWTDYDGEHPTPQVEEDSLASDRMLFEGLRLSGKRDARTLQWGHGLKVMISIASNKRIESLNVVHSDATAYMQHGAYARNERFWRILTMLHQGESALSEGKGRGFLAWLSKCWSIYVETPYTTGVSKRVLHGHNKTLACGTDYWLTHGQVNHLRLRRKNILRRHGKVSNLTVTNGKAFMSAYALKFLGTRKVSGNGIGTRGGMTFGTNPAVRSEPPQSGFGVARTKKT